MGFIIRVIKDKANPYVRINKEFIKNPNLSYKAKGIAAYIFCQPDDWEISPKELKSHGKEGRDAIYSGLKELSALGYMEKKIKRDPYGKIIGYDYFMYEGGRQMKKLK